MRKESVVMGLGERAYPAISRANGRRVRHRHVRIEGEEVAMGAAYTVKV